MTAAVWVALLGGAAAGSLVTGTVNWIGQRTNWQREDRHRFAATKLDAYGEFLTAAMAMQRLVAVVDVPAPGSKPTVVMRAAARYVRHGRKVEMAEDRFVQVWQRLLLVAPDVVCDAANGVSDAKGSLVQRGTRRPSARGWRCS